MIAKKDKKIGKMSEKMKSVKEKLKVSCKKVKVLKAKVVDLERVSVGIISNKSSTRALPFHPNKSNQSNQS